MKIESSEQRPNYARLDYVFRQHRARFRRYVEAHGLPCQDCGGAGGYKETIDPWLGGPWYECGFCYGTGKTTRWLRGQWLRWKRDEKRSSGRREA